jgi:hypothetical protein
MSSFVPQGTHHPFIVYVVVPNVDAHPKPRLRVQESLIIIARSSSSEDACQIPVHFYSKLHAERNQHQQFVQQFIAQQPGTQQFFHYQHVPTTALVSVCA